MIKTVSIAAIIAVTAVTSSFAGTLTDAEYRAPVQEPVLEVAGSSFNPLYIVPPFLVVCALVCFDDDDAASATTTTAPAD